MLERETEREKRYLVCQSLLSEVKNEGVRDRGTRGNSRRRGRVDRERGREIAVSSGFENQLASIDEGNCL